MKKKGRNKEKERKMEGEKIRGKLKEEMQSGKTKAKEEGGGKETSDEDRKRRWVVKEGRNEEGETRRERLKIE